MVILKLHLFSKADTQKFGKVFKISAEIYILQVVRLFFPKPFLKVRLFFPMFKKLYAPSVRNFLGLTFFSRLPRAISKCFPFLSG